jgi:hypothetical protein
MEIRMVAASADRRDFTRLTREYSWISTPPILRFFALTFPD